MKTTLFFFFSGVTHNILLEQQLVSCPTHSAPSVSCVIWTGQDVSVDDSRHVLSTPVQQENTADKNLVNKTLLGIKIGLNNSATLKQKHPPQSQIQY